MEPTFGGLLRRHRRARELSQEALALAADVSPRHLSCLETGRAQPSREMALGLAGILDLPLREQNSLLLAAGFAPIYRETPLDGPPLAETRQALELILRRQEPFGAVVLDRHWNVLYANRAYSDVHRLLLGSEDLPPYVFLPPGRVNAVRTFFRPDGMRRHVSNWAEVARALLPRLMREALSGDPVTCALAKEVLAYPGLPRLREAQPAFLIPLELRVGEKTLRLLSTLTTFGTAHDITLAELRIESFHPADAATDALVRALA
jgi:transcriptional regulator with XRE-family HTH domain